MISGDLELSRTEIDEYEDEGGLLMADDLQSISVVSQLHTDSSQLLVPSSPSQANPISWRSPQDTDNTPSRRILSAPSSATSRYGYGFSSHGVETSPSPGISEVNRYVCFTSLFLSSTQVIKSTTTYPIFIA
jgi:hypothetical protein